MAISACGLTLQLVQNYEDNTNLMTSTESRQTRRRHKFAYPKEGRRKLSLFSNDAKLQARK